MSDNFAFNARQYFDFSQNQEDLDGDSFFESTQDDNREKIHGVNNRNGQITEIELSDTESDSAFFSPMLESARTGVSASTVYVKTKMRRSLSMNDLPADAGAEHVQEEMANLNLEERPTSSCSQNSKKAPSQDHINKLAQPKRWTSIDNVSKNMTLAEAVKRFQVGTPQRFRTQPPRQTAKVAPLPFVITKPHSPRLMTTQRARPNHHVMSQEERENLEIQEAKRFKIKARPVNKKILKGPMKPPIEKKPPTAIEPFRLTEMKKREEVEVPRVPPFKAQPLPKTLHKPYKLQESAHIPIKTQTPTVAKRLTKSLPKLDTKDKVDAASKPFKPIGTQPKPFSFETRDMELMKKKQERINKILEEEKRAREFHARPPPQSILRARNPTLDMTTHQFSRRNSSFQEKGDYVAEAAFKARPATVLYIQPFHPKKDELHDLKVEPFQFKSDERVAAWQKFEEEQKEREEKMEIAKRQMEELNRKREEEEVARLRKMAEYKAQPIKKYKDIQIKKSNKITNPISPVFHTKDRLRNKENIEN